MKKSKKPAFAIQSITILAHGQQVTLTEGQYQFGASAQPCEICGEHGAVTFSYKCPICNHWHLSIDIEEW